MNMEKIEKFDDQLFEAERLKQEGQHEAAIRVCENILLQDLNCAEAYEEIGDNYLSLQKYVQAGRALERAVRLSPHSANANYLLGFAYSERGDHDAAVKLFEKSNELKPNHPEILRCLGWVYFHSSSHREGLVMLERARTIAPDDTLTLMDLGTCYFASRHLPEALECFQDILKLEPKNAKAKKLKKEIEELLKLKSKKS